MDEELDPDDGNPNSVLAQEYSELVAILRCQLDSVIMQLIQTVPGGAVGLNRQTTGGSAAPSDHIEAMLQYFRRANTAECSNFLQTVCLLCEGIPMHLESKLISVAGYACNAASSVTDQQPLTPPAEEQLTKRPRIDYWEQYKAEAAGSLQRRWKRLSEGLLKDVQPDKIWVSIRTANRVRDRPDQTPSSAERGGRTPEPDGDDGWPESRLTLESFLQGCTGKVTVLAGQPGSGKTLVMSFIGEQWTKGLGPIPSSHLFVLLEFRQLNLLSDPLSLSELLFHHYLPPDGDNEAKQAVVDYLLSNPEQSCWVLDGYDEFQNKLKRHRVQNARLDSEKPLPVAELISGLLSRQLLAGSTVLVTSRVRDVVDLDGLSDKVGQLLPWDHREVKECVNNFFSAKDGKLAADAAEILFSSRHLLAMSSLPALCNICCVFLQHLLHRHAEKIKMPGAKGVEVKKKRLEMKKKDAQTPDETGDNESRSQKAQHGGNSEETLTDGAKSRSTFSFTAAQIPATQTQIYLAAVAAFLSRHPDRTGGNDAAETSGFSESTKFTWETVSLPAAELCELSRLAWRGLEESRIIFLDEEVHLQTLESSIKSGLFSQVEVRGRDGVVVNAYCFLHLTVQEFLAALRIMTSTDVSDADLKKRFSLKTRWTTKSDQKTVFTDSLYLYVCGLASLDCTPALEVVAKATGLKAAQNWVQKRQALVIKLLKTLCQSATLTGPKILQLCHCVQESQNQQLAQLVVSVRPTLELRNFWLLPSDIEALAFVVNSVGTKGVGLDFGACSMELECLDTLSRCQYIHYLSFRSRKYGDKFAEKLSSVLPRFTALRKLEFCGASLSSAGAASLASGLQNCSSVTELNFSDNNLQDEGIRCIADVLAKLQNLTSVKLGRNNTSLEAAECLVKHVSSCSNIQQVHADGIKELTLTFSQKSESNSHKIKPEATVRLLNQKWTKSGMQNLAKSLARCPSLSELDLSGGEWDEETLKMLIQFVPSFSITERIILNDSCSSVQSVVILAALLSDCPSVLEMNIRLQDPVQVSVVFSVGREKSANVSSKKLCLSCCNLQPIDLERVWKSLGASSDLSDLDLSCNKLGDKGLKKLLDFLPHLSKIQRVDFSGNDVGVDGVVMLADALCSSNRLTHVYISDGGKDQVMLQFSSDTSNGKLKTKLFRIDRRSLTASDVNKVCRKLVQCRTSLELEFTQCSFAEKSIENLLRVLPKMSTLQRLNVSNSILSTFDALTLISCFPGNQRVSSVELSPQGESFIRFAGIKAEQVNCRLTDFSFKEENFALLDRLNQILLQTRQLSYLEYKPQLISQPRNYNVILILLTHLNKLIYCFFRFSLSGNQLEDEGVRRLLESLPNIRVSSFINLSKNSLSQQGALHVATTLCTCTNVSAVEVSLGEDERCLIWFTQKGGGEKTLSVKDSKLQYDHLLTLANIVSDCQSLTKVELKNNMLQSEWIENFVTALNVNLRRCTISVEERWIGGDDAALLLRRCLQLHKPVQTIRIDDTTLQLVLMDNMESDVAFPAQSVIKNISVSNSSVEGAKLLCSFLPSLPNLTSLSVGIKDSAVADELLHVILSSTSIQRLNLSGVLISDAAAQTLTRLLPRLRSFKSSHCVWSAAGRLLLIETLKESAALEELCLDAAMQLNEDCSRGLAQTLRNMRSLQILKLDEIVKSSGQPEADVVLDLLAGMEELNLIQEIQLSGWRMGDGGIQKLTGILPGWKDLRTISLSKNLVSDPSGEKLLEALSGCRHLEELHLSSNHIGDLTAARMALVLPSMSRLSVLDISENHVGNEGLFSLSRAIMSLKNLRKIHLTSVGNSELSAVAASLSHCPFIEDVGFGWNNCEDAVALELANVLPVCHDLTRIDLECNSVSAAGVEALVRALRCCPALQVIRLWRNKVSGSEALRFSQMERRLNFSST
ncbi:protein NLRC5-like isoform X3 [Xiphophorus maculatus]|uniref:protein NLRC5-like isoform X3 n=1 Tax=Xiphophorus maculatus TaxID=8083 RepID=UPI000C6E7A1F|nr:protein NLRC5-like isoform X3 [Xiphophorus maculatus]